MTVLPGRCWELPGRDAIESDLRSRVLRLGRRRNDR